MMARKKILLLNPPGKQVYLRDYFCSKVSQADYINHPIDLVCLSGHLSSSFDLELLDAIVERLSLARCLERIKHIKPHVIVGMIASVSYAEDVSFYRQVAAEVSARIILIGDVLIERREERLRELTFVEAFLHDFTSDDLLRYLQMKKPDASMYNLTYRIDGTPHAAPVQRLRSQDLHLPLPQHHLFCDKNYRYPFVRHRKFATVITEFGCPYPCTFCIMSTLGWKVRPVANILPEFDLLKRLGVRELFFLDQTFGIQKGRAFELIRQMRARRYEFGWVCFSRPDILSDTLLSEMKAAGCHTIILGLESGSSEILAASRKEYDLEEVKAGFQLCRQHGIRTVATVILGLPQETMQTFEQTMSLLHEISPDFASFNVAVPRMGTKFRETALAAGLAHAEDEIMDQSGREISLPTFALSKQEIGRLKRRAIREFYFNPRYLAGRIRRLAQNREGAYWDTRIQLRQTAGLIQSYLSLTMGRHDLKTECRTQP